MKHSRLIQIMLTFTLILALLCGCTPSGAQQDIVILYTNDVHCAVDSGVGYARLAAYKKQLEANNENVALVDLGDAIQGDAIGTVSKGEYPVSIMNETGYDLAVLGNHEFDYGMEQLTKLIEMADAQYLGCNIRFSGEGQSALADLKPYEIMHFGNKKVAFIGVSTPESITKSTPSYFMDEDGNFIYDFYSESGEELYSRVQEVTDECRNKGADYVILLAHLGDDEESAPFRSVDVIENTSGIDACLDGHSHSVISCAYIKNKDGAAVPLSSCGSNFEYFGRLTISSSGSLTLGLVDSYPNSDKETENFISEIKQKYEADLNQVVAKSDTKLSTASENGIRLIRNRETNLGDFLADAYRAVAGTDIAIVNGGGIRADLPAGDITYGDIIAVHPYGNTLCSVEATGQEILDALEMASRFTMSQTSDSKNAVGESGAFLQVSGLRYTIDTSVQSTVEVDSAGMFVSCGANRRIKNAEVLQSDGTYAPLEPEKTYTLASHNYTLKQGGDGLNMFMDNTFLIDEGMADYQILITYISENLGGIIGDMYKDTDGRITVL